MEKRRGQSLSQSWGRSESKITEVRKGKGSEVKGRWDNLG